MHTEHDYWQSFAAHGRVRRYKRHRVRVPVTLTTDSDEVLRGFSNDVSEAGMAFYISKHFQIGQCIRVDLRPPGSQDELSIDAIVRHCDGFRCGVEFNDFVEALR